MVLAAGLGTRMRPLSHLAAKPVLPVLNRPLLRWTLELLARSGVDEVIVNLHHRPGSVRRALGDGRDLGLRITYSYERRVLGTAGGPRKVRERLGDQPFLLVNGDVAFDFDLRSLYNRHLASGAQATLALLAHPRARSYGAVITDRRGRVLSLAGLPRPARGTASLFTGVHVLSPALLDRLPRGPSDSVRDLYAPLVAEGGRILGVRVRGAWYDLGSPALYLASQVSMMASGFRDVPRGAVVDPDARVAAEARVEASVVGAGVVVEAGARVTGSVLWPGARVGAGAAVRDAILAGRVRVLAGERLAGTAVLPARRLGRQAEGLTRRGDQVYVEIRR